MSVINQPYQKIDTTSNERFTFSQSIIEQNYKVPTEFFESDSIDKYWDGEFNTKKVQQGAYYYNIEVLGKDKQMYKKSGEINVIY